MKYCSKCQKAFYDGETCPKCKGEGEVPENINIPTHLITACGFEKDRIKASLNDVGIPFIEKSEEKEIHSEAVVGGNVSNKEIFVPFSAYNKARKALMDIGAIEPSEHDLLQNDEADNTETTNEPHTPTRTQTIALLLLVLLLVGATVVFTDTVIAFIKDLISG